MNKNILKIDNIHTDSLFPLSCSTITTTSSNNILNLHWHDEIEFILIVDGNVIFQIENNKYNVNAGDILIIGSGEIHSICKNSNDHCTFKSIIFNPEMLSSKSSDSIQVKFINPLINNQIELPRYLSGKNIDEVLIRNYLSELFDVLDNKEMNYELMAKSLLYMIFSKVMKFTKSKSDSISMDTIKKILNYIHLNYNKPLTINDLATEANLSQGYFCRLFKKHTFKTPIDYINHYRITKSQELLINTDMKISDICYEVGFNNLSYFISLFKNVTSETPAQFRKKYKQ